MSTLTILPRRVIKPSATNPRRYFDEDALEDLAKSLREVGMLQPIVVRPIEGSDEHEIVAGERRWRAAERAGLDEVPAIVRELTDVQAAELQIVENLQRQDISALEEAEGFRRLIDLGAHTADSLAARLGKSRSHVFSRLRLTGLGDAVRDALGAGKIEATTAELLAKFDSAELQKEALGEILAHNDWEKPVYPVPFRKARERLAEFYPALSGAPWKDSDDSLQGGACRDCHKRSGNMPDVPDGVKGTNVCTDRHCFRARVTEVRLQRHAQLQRDGVNTPGTLEEHDTQFLEGREGELRHNSAFVALKTVCWEAKKEAPWEKVLKGLEVATQTLVAPDGSLVQVVERKAALAAASKAGKLQTYYSKQASDSPEDAKAARAKKIAENRRARAVTEMLAQQALLAAADQPDSTFWAQYLAHTVPYSGQKYLAGEIGSNGFDADAAVKHLEDLSIVGLREKALLAQISDGAGQYNAWAVEQWAERFGVKVEAFEKKALAEVIAAEKANAKAKKGGRK